MKEILWFLGILALFFFIWLIGGGPERAERQGVSPIINGPINVAPADSTPNIAPNNATTNPEPAPANNTNTGGEIRVTPV